MTGEQLKLLAKMKRLILAGKRRFLIRQDRNHLQELVDIGITEKEAWDEILSLSNINYFHDYKPFYSKRGDDALTFKKEINRQLVYIKLKIEKEKNNELTVCLSFHIDYQ